MTISSYYKYIFFVLTLVSLVSCDEDANEIGANIVGSDNFEFGEPEDYNVVAYTQKLDNVESVNLKSDASGTQQLGIYDNPVFGKTTSHVVTEVRLPSDNPVDFTLDPQIVSAVLSIPYFAHKTITYDNGNSDYELDSIYGPAEGKLDLGIYESTFYIRPDPSNNGLPMPSYSDELSFFTKGPKLNNSNQTEQNTQFVFNDSEDEEIVTNELNVSITTKVGPRMEIDLDTNILGPKLFGPNAVGKLINNNIFTTYFNGLHFSVAQSGSLPVRMAVMDFNRGKIVVKYTQRASTASATRVEKTLTLTLNANNVNLFEYQHTPMYANALAATPDRNNGDRKLYVKGGQGSMAVVELFRTPEELAALRSAKGKRLVNDASLSFYIEKNDMASAPIEPNRVYLYDLSNKKPLVDFSTDVTTAVNVKYNKRIHGGIIEKSSDGRGTRYKVRITNYIRTLINDATIKNVRLGLVVTENINATSNKRLKNAIVLPDNVTFGEAKTIDGVPTMSVANPFGTILYGSNIPEGDPDYDKRLKLTIYYTNPN